MTQLLLADVDAIQGYIFASSRLREMAGASRLIERWSAVRTREVLAAAAGPNGNWDAGRPPDSRSVDTGAAWEVLVSAGGVLLARLADDVDPIGIEAELRRQFYAHTAGWTIATASVQTGGVKGHLDSSALDELQREIRTVKDFRRQGATPQVRPADRRCRSCAGGAAVKTDDNWDICAACVRKRWARQQLASPLEDCREVRVSSKPWEFDGLADGRQFIAVVVADGDGVGDRWGQLGDADAYRAFSSGLSRTVNAALCGALAECGVATRDGVLQAELAMFGGDDITLVVPGAGGVELAEALCRRFRLEAAKTCLSALDGLTMSAGVAIVKKSHPFQMARELALHCLRRAKAERRVRNTGDGCLDFAVLTAEHPGALGLVLGERYAGYGGQRLCFSGRPYAVDGVSPDQAATLDNRSVVNASALIAASREMRQAVRDADAARGRLAEIDGILRTVSPDETPEAARTRATAAYARVLTRMQQIERDDGDKRAPSGILLAAVNAGKPDDGPWSRDGNGPAIWTPIPDIIELIPYLKGAS